MVMSCSMLIARKMMLLRLRHDDVLLIVLEWGVGCCFFLGLFCTVFVSSLVHFFVHVSLELFRQNCVLCYVAAPASSAFTLSAVTLSNCFRAFVIACGYVHLWPLVSSYICTSSPVFGHTKLWSGKRKKMLKDLHVVKIPINIKSNGLKTS